MCGPGSETREAPTPAKQILCRAIVQCITEKPFLIFDNDNDYVNALCPLKDCSGERVKRYAAAAGNGLLFQLHEQGPGGTYKIHDSKADPLESARFYAGLSTSKSLRSVTMERRCFSVPGPFSSLAPRAM